MLVDPGGFAARLREASFDRLGRLVPPESASDAVVIDIDRRSLATKGAWPWRRAMLADLLQKAQAGRPKAIGIDILLSGLDRRSPASLLRAFAEETGRQDLATLAQALPGDDARLAGRIAQSDVVLGSVLDPQGRDLSLPEPSILSVGRPIPLRLSDGGGLAAPWPPLSDKAFAVGALSLSAGPGDLVRDVPIFVRTRGKIQAGFAAELFRASEKAAAFILEDGGPAVSIGQKTIPIGVDGAARVRFTSPRTWPARTVSAAAVLDGEVDPTRFENKIVLIGSSAPEAGALIATPSDPLTPTVQWQADAVASFQSGTSQRLVYADRLEMAAALLIAILALLAVLLTAPVFSVLVLGVLSVAWIGASVVGFAHFKLRVDPVGPLLPALAAWGVASFVLFGKTLKLRRAIEQRFGRYVSPQIVSRLTRTPSELKIAGELREVTALFSDIEGFSAMTERADPRLLIATLDAYFEGICAIVIRYGGMVDKVVGDAVHSLFNAPLDLKDHPQAALACALEIERFAMAFCTQENAQKLGFGRTRIGLETGLAIVGDVGGPRHLDYTAHGAAVNAAARLEALNKAFGTTICIGPNAAKAIGMPDKIRPLALVELRGAAMPALIHTSWPQDATAEQREAYLSAHALIGSDPDKARLLFERLVRQRPDDPAAAHWARHLTAERLPSDEPQGA